MSLGSPSVRVAELDKLSEGGLEEGTAPSVADALPKPWICNPGADADLAIPMTAGPGGADREASVMSRSVAERRGVGMCRIDKLAVWPASRNEFDVGFRTVLCGFSKVAL